MNIASIERTESEPEEIEQFELPEEEQIKLDNLIDFRGVISCSKDYLAFNCINQPPANTILLFPFINADKKFTLSKKHTKKFSVENQIHQLKLMHNSLFVVTQGVNQETLIVFNIDTEERKSEIILPYNPKIGCKLIFGNDRIVGILEHHGKFTMYEVLLSSSTPTHLIDTNKVAFNTLPWIFADDKDFIAVTCENNKFKIERIVFENDKNINVETICSDAVFFDENVKLETVFYKHDRLFISYRDTERKIAIYDFRTNTLNKTFCTDNHLVDNVTPKFEFFDDHVVHISVGKIAQQPATLFLSNLSYKG